MVRAGARVGVGVGVRGLIPAGAGPIGYGKHLSRSVLN